MFSLTVLDHVRLDSEHTDRNYTIHARAAERIVRVVFACRMVIAVLLAAATATTIAALLLSGRTIQIAAVVTTALAFLAFVTYLVLGLEARLHAHRGFVHRLWIVAERYRSLLAEVHDGTVDPTALLRRRDELIHDLHVIYEFGFGSDQQGYESVRLADLPDQRAA
jgi:hypothetical protein